MHKKWAFNDGSVFSVGSSVGSGKWVKDMQWS